MKLRFTEDANEHIDIIDEWWRENRPRAPNLFDDELARVIALLPSSPKMGVIYPHEERTIYKVLMKRTHHYVYYEILEGDVIEIQIVWGTPLKDGPPL